MAWSLHHEVEENVDFELVTTVADIQLIKREGKRGDILKLEGLEPRGNGLRLQDLFYRPGVRIVGFTHNRRNLFAYGLQPGVRR
jgi:microsomal dipeptidase-like Zn-dependent dipeptidase